MTGPTTQAAQHLHSIKYREDGEIFDDYCVRYAKAAADTSDSRHFRDLLDALRYQRLLPAGRQQLAVGRPNKTTAFNCFVGATIPDSIAGIMEECKDSALTLRTGGGCGWDFSTLRPYGEPVRGLGQRAYATGPVSFMGIWHSMCETIMSAGHRRGAMMGVLRVDHPDIMRFINAKSDQSALSNFNISVAITKPFMEALLSKDGGTYDLQFEGRVYDTVRAADVWARIMERNWDWAEPGVLFIDQINKMNPLGYCESIAATNPCGEQPLPPHGACLLGSLNIPKYLVPTHSMNNVRNVQITELRTGYEIDFHLLARDINVAVRAYDNVIDRTTYPLPQQAIEAKRKRRMGLGPTGMANALEIIGYRYGTPEYIAQQDIILKFIRDEAYSASIYNAQRKGAFPAWNYEGWAKSGFVKTLSEKTRAAAKRHGLRNGLLLSIAPTGTISQCADNVSAGIEPPFALALERTIEMPGGPTQVQLEDFAFREHGVKGLTAQEVSPQEHVEVLCAAQRFVDSAVSKTCNVNGTSEDGGGEGLTTYSEFQKLYEDAWKGGAKGCTTFNINGERYSMMQSLDLDKEPDDGAACFVDPVTGARSCE